MTQTTTPARPATQGKMDMKTIDTVESLNGARNVESPGWLLCSAAAVVVLLSLAMAVNAKDLRAPQAQGAVETSSATPAINRSPSDIEWNAHEDLKASRYQGQPGIY